ncbi:MAG: uroporphyrinogen-III synthase [Alphaproteobacteria bacterium]
MRLLVTRPEPDATRTAETLRARGHEVLVAPLLATLAIAVDFAGPYDGVLMTSANAARALAAHPRRDELTRLPCFTVGSRTAEAAQAAGFAETMSADGARSDLVNLVAGKFDRFARLLYLAGEDRAGDLAGDLAKRGIAVETAVIYSAVAAEKLPAHVTEALKHNSLDGALHYSRRSVATLLAHAGHGGAGALADLIHYCLSAEVAVPLREAGVTRIVIAARPDEASLLALIPE